MRHALERACAMRSGSKDYIVNLRSKRQVQQRGHVRHALERACARIAGAFGPEAQQAVLRQPGASCAAGAPHAPRPGMPLHATPTAAWSSTGISSRQSHSLQDDMMRVIKRLKRKLQPCDGILHARSSVWVRLWMDERNPLTHAEAGTPSGCSRRSSPATGAACSSCLPGPTAAPMAAAWARYSAARACAHSTRSASPGSLARRSSASAAPRKWVKGVYKFSPKPHLTPLKPPSKP